MSFRDIRYSDKLKYQGHDIIDDLVRMGVPRYRVYRRMAKVLRLTEAEAHFGAATKIERLEKMVAMLSSYREHVASHMRRPKLIRPTLYPKKKKKQKKGFVVTMVPAKEKKKTLKAQVLPREQMVQALAELKLYKSTEREGAARSDDQISPIQRILAQIGVV